MKKVVCLIFLPASSVFFKESWLFVHSTTATSVAGWAQTKPKRAGHPSFPFIDWSRDLCSVFPLLIDLDCLFKLVSSFEKRKPYHPLKLIKCILAPKCIGNPLYFNDYKFLLRKSNFGAVKNTYDPIIWPNLYLILHINKITNFQLRKIQFSLKTIQRKTHFNWWSLFSI